MNIKYVIVMFTVLTGTLSYSAASNSSPTTKIDLLALLYEGAADKAPSILASLYKSDLEKLVKIGRREPQRFPNLYRDAKNELSMKKTKFLQLLQEHNGIVQKALRDAAENNKAWAIGYLVQNGADVNATENYYDRTALMFASHCGHETVVAQLIAANADVNAKESFYDRTAFILAAERGHEAVVAQLIAAGADVNMKDNNGRTAFMLAADKGHKAVVARLLAAGADINVKDKYGRTALVLAAEGGHKAVAAQLIAAGADVGYLELQLRAMGIEIGG